MTGRSDSGSSRSPSAVERRGVAEQDGDRLPRLGRRLGGRARGGRRRSCRTETRAGFSVPHAGQITDAAVSVTPAHPARAAPALRPGGPATDRARGGPWRPNRGGETAFPVTAIRIGRKKSPAFQPSASAAARQAASSASAVHSSLRSERIAGRAERAGNLAAVPALRQQVVDRPPGRDHIIGFRQEAGQLGGIGQANHALLHQRHQPGQSVSSDSGRRDERAEPSGQLGIGQGADVDAIEVVEPVAVEHGASLVDLGDLEPLRQLVQREQLLFRPGRPAEEGEEVDHRLGQVALGAVVADRGLRLALAHLRPIRVKDQRDVPEHRLAVARARGSGRCAWAC